MNRLIRVFTKLAILVALGVLVALKCNAQINVAPSVTDQLTRDYIEYTLKREVEFAFCLYGAEVNDTTYVTVRTIPSQRGVWGSVSWQACAPVFMGLAYVAYGHSHPPDEQNSHRPSGLDLYTFSQQPVRYTFIVFARRGIMYATILQKS